MFSLYVNSKNKALGHLIFTIYVINHKSKRDVTELILYFVSVSLDVYVQKNFPLQSRIHSLFFKEFNKLQVLVESFLLATT